MRVVQAQFAAVDDGFVLLVQGRELLRHGAGASAVRCGTGQPDITMVRGNFRIEDEARWAEGLRVGALSPDQVSLVTAEGQPALALRLQRPDDTSGAATVLQIEAADAACNRLWLGLAALPDEHVWGGGEQMSYLALNGRRFPMWTSEPGVGRDKTSRLTQLMDQQGMAGGDYWTTNYPQPTFLTSAGLGVHVTTEAYSELGFEDPAVHGIEVWSGAVEIELYGADTPAGLVAQFARRFGTPAPLPDWAIGGAIIGLKAGADSFARLAAIRAAGVPVRGLWCEDWVGVRQTSFGRRLFWDWQWSAARYPDLPRQIAELKREGIAFLGYVNPYLAVDGALYGEARALGLLALRLDSDEPYHVDFGEFDAAVVDFTNPAACDWFAEEIIARRMLDFGLEGWMADFGEYLPVDLRLFDGSDPMEAHNRWPVLWARVNADGIARRGKTGQATFFMRAGFCGVQAHCPLLWAGDQSVDFSRHDGINTVITAALSAGLVGNRVSHSDVGGYTSLHGVVRTQELLLRWMELAAFTPVFRSHEGNRPDDNLQLDSTPELLAHCAAFARVHRALAPYVRTVLDEGQASGLPAQRALFLDFPQERATWTCQDQYLYGPDLLVAPVVEAGAQARTVLLPGAASWVHLWSGAHVPPGVHQVAAPLGEPPVFYRPESPWRDLFANLPAHHDGQL
jgi:sulfoquinovosidase